MLLSICIPCYKRINEVRNTLRSIYIDNADISIDQYEVIISDNDPDGEIECLLVEFPASNLKYHKTKCEGFMNSYYALNYANGKFLKLHNSQSIFRKGSIRSIINDIKRAASDRSTIFYTNGMLNQNELLEFHDYNLFMKKLSYWSSWSNGFSIWKNEFDLIKNTPLNNLFPHTSLFLAQSQPATFYINDRYLFDVQRIPKRGGHNKFAAFSVEYPSLIIKHYKEGRISERAKQIILKDIVLEMLPTLIFNKYIVRIENFDIDGYRENLKKFFPWYTYYLTFILSFLTPIRKLYNRILRKFINK